MTLTLESGSSVQQSPYTAARNLHPDILARACLFIGLEDNDIGNAIKQL
jgi:hypothetical protein